MSNFIFKLHLAYRWRKARREWYELTGEWNQ